MSLTITIPGAVNVTTGAMAPAVLTVGVGVPGAAGPQGPAGPGVPAGGTAGQYLQKIDGTNYNTDWVTVNLGAYAVKANNLSDLTNFGTARTNLGLGTMAVATAADYSTTTVANGLYYPLAGNPSSFLTAAALSPYLLSSTAASTYQTLAGMSDYLSKAGNLAGLASTSTARTNLGLGSLAVINDAPSDGSQYARKNGAWDVVTSTSSYITSVSSPLSVTSGNLTIDLSPYAPLASPALTGNVTITSNSSGAALFIEQTGTGNILTLHDQASDTTFVAIDQNGKIGTIASTTTNAGFNVPHGTAPTSPVNGDIWTTTAGLLGRFNGTTLQFAPLGSNNTFSNASSTYGSSTATGTIGLASGATISGSTKTLNIGTGGVAGSTTNIAIGSTTGTSTTTLQGITNGVTAAADTNSVALATTAYVVGQASAVAPSNDAGTAAVGTSLRYARADHVHLNPLPAGGSANQVLAKIDGTDYNTEWVAAGGFSGGVVANPIQYTGAVASVTFGDPNPTSTQLFVTDLIADQTGSFGYAGLFFSSVSSGNSLSMSSNQGVTLTGNLQYNASGAVFDWNGINFATSSSAMNYGRSTIYFPDNTQQSTAGIGDAPSNGNYYVRQNGSWVQCTVVSIYDSNTSTSYNCLTV